MKIAIAGATGMVGRKFAELLSDHPWYEIVSLAGFKSAGAAFGEIWEKKESELSAHYGEQFWTRSTCPETLREKPIQNFESLLENRSVDFVFSAIPPNVCDLEQRLLEAGFMVFSNTPFGRLEKQNPLVVAEVNGDEIRTQKFIKNPNCVTSGLVLSLAPIREIYGLEAVSVVTFQSLSGRGDAKYPREAVVSNVYPLKDSDEKIEEYIALETQKIFHDETPISICSHRVYVQEGHYAVVKIKTKRRVKSDRDVVELLRAFNPLAKFSLPSSPKAPLFILNETGRPRPRQDSYYEKGMTVAVGGISTNDAIFDLRLQFVVNNLIRGAAGGAILNSELYLQRQHQA